MLYLPRGKPGLMKLASFFAAIILVQAWTVEGVEKTSFEMVDEIQRETLRGLPGVWVAVEKLDPDIEREGMSREQIQTDLELRLRNARITVLTFEEMLKLPAKPWLYVRVETIRSQLGNYAIHIQASVHQLVLLKGLPAVKSYDAATWAPPGYIGIASATRVQSAIREAVANSVDQFMNAYLAVNPQ